jgi:hypothetical protein
MQQRRGQEVFTIRRVATVAAAATATLAYVAGPAQAASCGSSFFGDFSACLSANSSYFTPSSTFTGDGTTHDSSYTYRMIVNLIGSGSGAVYASRALDITTAFRAGYGNQTLSYNFTPPGGTCSYYENGTHIERIRYGMSGYENVPYELGGSPEVHNTSFLCGP